MILNSSLLILAAMIWGAGFIATKWTFADYGPFWSNTLRFYLATAVILPYILYKIKTLKPKDYLPPLACSALLFLGMQTQTIGLKYTTAAKSGFLTTFYAFFTPIILMLFYKVRYQKSFWILLCFSLMGIALLCNLEVSEFNIGDWWTLACALMFAGHIILMSKIANNYNAVVLNGLQCVFVALISTPLAFIIEGVPTVEHLFTLNNLTTPGPLLGFIILGVFSSNVAFSIQAFAQKSIPPHIVSLIFLMESIFAAIFGYLFLAEKLTPMAMAGCGLVLVSLALVPKFGRIQND